MTQSDLIYLLLILSYYCFNLNLTQIKTVICVLKYNKKTLNYDIYYEDKKDLIKYIDVDYAEIIDSHCFINDYTFLLLKNLIS